MRPTARGRLPVRPSRHLVARRAVATLDEAAANLVRRVVSQVGQLVVNAADLLRADRIEDRNRRGKTMQSVRSHRRQSRRRWRLDETCH